MQFGNHHSFKPACLPADCQLCPKINFKDDLRAPSSPDSHPDTEQTYGYGSSTGVAATGPSPAGLPGGLPGGCTQAESRLELQTGGISRAKAH